MNNIIKIISIPIFLFVLFCVYYISLPRTSAQDWQKATDYTNQLVQTLDIQLCFKNKNSLLIEDYMYKINYNGIMYKIIFYVDRFYEMPQEIECYIKNHPIGQVRRLEVREKKLDDHADINYKLVYEKEWE